MPNSNDFAKFIDELRDSRNISREAFVKDIISLRQYYRYIRGESSLKDDTINALMNRLEINSIEAHRKYLRGSNSIRSKLDKIYSLVRALDFVTAKKILDTIEPEELTSQANSNFYHFLKYVLAYNLENDSKEESLNKIINLVNYPKILNKDILTFYELSALFFVADYLIKVKGDYRIAHFTYDVLSNKSKHYFTTTPNYLITFYSSSARHLGKIGEYEKSLEIANAGIAEAKKLAAYNNYPNLLFYKAVSENHLELIDESKKTLIRLFSMLKSIDDKNISNTFFKSIERVFNISESDLITYKV